MARLIEERPTEDVEEQDTDNLVEQEPQTEEVEETPEQTEADVPEKYQGKSTAEIVRMHQEAEKLLGKQSSEVGELRKVVDDYIQTQLSTQETQATQADEEIDFFSDPDKAVERAINNHPKIKEAEQISNQYRQSTAMNKLQTKHPEMQEILQDEKFAEWIKGSKIRQQLFVQADQQYDYDAADELFSLWKERQQVVTQTVANEKQQRKQAVKSASTGNANEAFGTKAKQLEKVDLLPGFHQSYIQQGNFVKPPLLEGRLVQ